MQAISDKLLILIIFTAITSAFAVTNDDPTLKLREATLRMKEYLEKVITEKEQYRLDLEKVKAEKSGLDLKLASLEKAQIENQKGDATFKDEIIKLNDENTILKKQLTGFQEREAALREKIVALENDKTPRVLTAVEKNEPPQLEAKAKTNEKTRKNLPASFQAIISKYKLELKEDNKGLYLKLPEVNFGYGRYKINSNKEKRVVKILSDIKAKHAGQTLQFEVTGNTDRVTAKRPKSAFKSNLSLGLKRIISMVNLITDTFGAEQDIETINNAERYNKRSGEIRIFIR